MVGTTSDALASRHQMHETAEIVRGESVRNIPTLVGLSAQLTRSGSNSSQVFSVLLVMAQPNKKKTPAKDSDGPERRIVCTNRRARHEYDVLDEIDCGIVLTGSEVKSVRNNKISIEEAYARVDNHEVWLVDCDIAEYAQASIYNHARQRKRKLLLKRREIRKVIETAEHDGQTLIPLSVFFQRGLVKIRLGLCKGRKIHDKRQRLKEQDARREMREEKLR